ncbi:putative membrane protein [Candidatus Paraburkholderia kirkii UZHbot1]|uniref:Putative membrane protein n=1 Tax=Candidatus Paraburkholderia kirkii UZHbot1 TaxID=1055526 RepID=G4M2B1_9BURK|nr:putative membrane protein [Candidatus Paraburkholderia kirkii UZHbot1]
MSLIIAGRFQTFRAAESAAQRLFAHGFFEEDVTLFFVNPSGQHALYPVGGDIGTDTGASAAPKGAGKGVTIGVVVGAYVGSLVGAMSHTKKPKVASHADEPARHAGVLVAVHVSPDTQEQASATLREAGGMDIERASGRWKQGRWADFDPRQPPHPVGEFAQPHT